jgi:hypothetical protein
MHVIEDARAALAASVMWFLLSGRSKRRKGLL